MEQPPFNSSGVVSGIHTQESLPQFTVAVLARAV